MTATSTIVALAAAEAGATAPAPQNAPAPQPEASAAAIQAAVDTALKAERARLTAIDDLTLKGFEAAAKTAKDTGLSAEAFAIETLKTIKKDGLIDAVAALKSADAKVPPIPPAGSAIGAGDEKATSPDGWRAEFAANSDLQDEYGSADAYVAYRQGVADGRIRHLTKTN